MAKSMDAGYIPTGERVRKAPVLLRWMLPLAWALCFVGYQGVWIAHDTAALSLSGVDLGEFVKFLPGVLDGALRVIRVLFYLPVAAVVASIALFAFARRLSLSRSLRLLVLVMAVVFSLQVLPPAWSPTTLSADEFRTQVVALGALWIALIGSSLWARVPVWLTAPAGAVLALSAAGSTGWQLVVVKSHIEAVYGAGVPIGWGLVCCQAGLLLLAGACLALGLMRQDGRRRR